MQCRFCLETDNESMVSPCRCRGSVEFIHTACRRAWVIVDNTIQIERIPCSICKAPLYENLEFVCASGPARTTWQRILYHPVEVSFAVHYIFLLCSNTIPKSPLERIYSSQLFVQLFYVLLYALHARIRNPELYRQIALKRRSYMHTLFHALFLWFFFKDGNLLMALASNLSLVVYRHEHMYILSSINEKIIKN